MCAVIHISGKCVRILYGNFCYDVEVSKMQYGYWRKLGRIEKSLEKDACRFYNNNNKFGDFKHTCRLTFAPFWIITYQDDNDVEGYTAWPIYVIVDGN